MDEKTKETLAEYLEKLLKAAEAGATWTVDQIPLVIQEKLQFDFWWSISSTLFWFLLTGLAFILWRVLRGVAYKNQFPNYGEDNPYLYDAVNGDGNNIVGIAILSLTGFMAFLSVIFEGQTALKILLAPRLYIIEWLVEITKNVS